MFSLRTIKTWPEEFSQGDPRDIFYEVHAIDAYLSK